MTMKSRNRITFLFVIFLIIPFLIVFNGDMFCPANAASLGKMGGISIPGTPPVPFQRDSQMPLSETNPQWEEPPPPPGVYYPPTVGTSMTSAIHANNATSGGYILSDGGATVIDRGVCWNTDENPTTAGNCTRDGTGTGEFTSIITGLEPDSIYHVRAYATNRDPYGIVRTGYGEERRGPF